jgi:hypothetical protein
MAKQQSHQPNKQQKNSPPKQVTSKKISSNSAPLHIPLWAIALVFIATTLIFFRAQIFGAAYFWEDFTDYVYPAQVFAAKFLHAGELPFWNPYTFSGAPFLADVAVGFFYPPNMLLALFVHDGKLSAFAVEFVIIAHFALAQFSMFLLMRSFSVSDAGALISAVSYGFSSYLVCHAFHPMMVEHCAWFPLAWLYFRKTLVSDEPFRQRLHSSLLAGLVLGVMMLSGHPQTTLYLVLLLFFYTVWAFVTSVTDKKVATPNTLHYGILAALPIIIGAGIFAVQLLHSQEFAAYSERNNFSLEKASLGALQLQQLFTLVVPKLFGFALGQQASEPLSVPFYLENGGFYYWETAFYVGIPALVLGIIGFAVSLVSRESENLGGLMLFAFIFAILYALGTNGFLFELMFKLPLFDRFRIPSRMLIYCVLGLTMMAGIGFDALWKNKPSILRTSLIASGIVAVIALLGASGILASLAGAPSELVERYSGVLSGFGIVAFVFIVLMVIILWLVVRGTLKPLVGGVVLTLLSFLDLSLVGSAFNQNMVNPAETYERTGAAIPQRMRADAMPTDSLYRLSIRTRGAMLMSQNQGLITPVMLYEGYMPILIERRLPLAPTGEQTLDLLNIRYAVAIDSASGEPFFRERQSAFPRARMLYDVVETTPDKSADLAKSGTVNFSTQALIEKPLAVPLPKQVPNAVQHRVHCTQYSANRIGYDVETAENGLLTLSEIWYPAWKATLDGQETEILRTNYSLRGIAVPKGKHTIVLRYDSSAFRLGAWISLGTVLLTAIGIVVLGRVSRKVS